MALTQVGGTGGTGGTGGGTGWWHGLGKTGEFRKDSKRLWNGLEKGWRIYGEAVVRFWGSPGFVIQRIRYSPGSYAVNYQPLKAGGFRRLQFMILRKV